MSLEKDLKDTLARHENDTRPRARAFEVVEAKVRRGHHRRLASAAVLGVAIIVAAGITVPQLLSGEPTDPGFADPSASPEPAPVPDGSMTFRHEEAGIQLVFPEDWRVGGFEGSTEFNPPGEPGLTVGEPTTAVELMLLHGERYDDADGYEPADDIGGRDAVSRSEGEYSTLYRVDWTGAACTPGAVCDAEISTLQVFVFASDADRWDRWGDDLDAIVRSIEPTHTAAYPTGRVRTPRGEVAGNVAYDEHTALLVRFLERRVAGGGAEPLMSPAAEEAYRTDPQLDLYHLDEGESGWLEYLVSGRADDEMHGPGFEVDLTDEIIEGHGPRGVTELITIHPGRSAVSDAEVIGAFTA